MNEKFKSNIKIRAEEKKKEAEKPIYFLRF